MRLDSEYRRSLGKVGIGTEEPSGRVMEALVGVKVKVAAPV